MFSIYLTLSYFLILISRTPQIQANVKTDTIPILAIFISEGINEVRNVLFGMKKDEAKASWLETATKEHKIRKNTLRLLLKLLALRLWDLTCRQGYKVELSHHQTFKVVFLTVRLLQYNLQLDKGFT